MREAVQEDLKRAEKALALLAKASHRITKQASKVKDVEIATQLDLLKMAQWKCQGRLKDYLKKMREEKSTLE